MTAKNEMTTIYLCVFIVTISNPSLDAAVMDDRLILNSLANSTCSF